MPRTFARKIALLVIAILIGAVGLAHVFSNLLLGRVVEQSRAETLDLAARLVTQGVEVQDRALALVEQRMDERMRRAMALLQKAYAKNPEGAERIDLDGIVRAVGGGVDLFVLDRDFVVTHTNFAKDLGVNIAVGDFARFLEGVLASGQYVSDRPILSLHDGMKKFAYQATPDRRRILEVGMALRPEQEGVSGLAFDRLAAGIVKAVPSIAGVDLLAQHHVDFFSVNRGVYLRLQGPRLAAAAAAVEDGERRMASQDGRDYHYIPLERGQGQPAHQVVELVFDNSGWAELRSRYARAQTLGHLLLAVAGVAAAALAARRLVRPVAQLSRSVRAIAAGDLDTPVPALSGDEVGLLARDVDRMRSGLAELLARLEAANEELAQSYDITIRAFFKALKHNESGTAEHSLRVNRIAMRLGRALGLSQEQLTHLEWGSLLHDIGKLAIPNEIILKRGGLTDREREVVRSHPQLGFEMLKDATFLGEALGVALHHQERFDGSGYPHGLSGRDIPLLARVCAVADAYEAMTADRSYRAGRSHAEALAEIRQKAGSQFDPGIVTVFLGFRAEDCA